LAMAGLIFVKEKSNTDNKYFCILIGSLNDVKV